MKTQICVLQNEEKLKDDFLKCLHSRLIIYYFSFWGKNETNQWINFCKNENTFIHKGNKLFKKTIKNANNLIKNKNLNFVSLGISDGKKDNCILKELSKEHITSYYPIDISQNMIKEGMDKFGKDLFN